MLAGGKIIKAGVEIIQAGGKNILQCQKIILSSGKIDLSGVKIISAGGQIYLADVDRSNSMSFVGATLAMFKIMRSGKN